MKRSCSVVCRTLLFLGVCSCVAARADCGTYSAYVRYLRGFALTVDISIGATDPHQAEAQALAARRAELRQMLTTRVDRHFQRLVDRFARAPHRYRRCLFRLDFRRHRWPSVEAMWASELISRPVRLVLPSKLLRRPRPPGPLASPAAKVDQVDLQLFFKRRPPPEISRILALHFVISQWRRLKEHLPTRSTPPDDRVMTRIKADVGLSTRSLRVLKLARLNRPLLRRIASAKGKTPGPKIRERLIAAGLLAAIDGRPLSAEERRLVRLPGHQQEKVFIAGTLSDANWRRTRRDYAAFDWADYCAGAKLTDENG